MYTSDWHIHSSASYDAQLLVPDLINAAAEIGVTRFGITDHANFPIPSFFGNLEESKRLHDKYGFEGFYLGVELTTIPRTMYEHCIKTGRRDTYTSTNVVDNYELEFMLTMEDLERFGMSYTVAAAHSAWHTDVSKTNEFIIEWHRHHMYIANDERVDILGHPWWFDKPQFAVWLSDFSVIPVSMHDELACALKENGVCIEANAGMIYGTLYTEKFYRQYCEYMRYMFEKGVKVTFGSDCHGPLYVDHRLEVEKALGAVGFKSEDFASPGFRR